MLQYDFENSVAYWIVMTARVFERALSAELSPHGITYRQWQVLGWLAIEGPLCQADLADRMQIEPATLVRVLDRMEEAGWVNRQGCPGDRRKKIIAPTEGARPVWNRVARTARTLRERAAHGIDAADLARLKSLLGTIQANLDPSHASARTGDDA